MHTRAVPYRELCDQAPEQWNTSGLVKSEFPAQPRRHIQHQNEPSKTELMTKLTDKSGKEGTVLTTGLRRAII